MIKEATVKCVLDRFGVLETSIDSVEPLDRGTKGTSVRVRADGRTWALKSVPPSQVARVRHARLLETRLADAGFPVAPLRRTTSQDAVLAHEGMYYSLHAWVDGHQFSIAQRERVIADRPQFLHDLGVALGTMHRSAESMSRVEGGAPVRSGEALIRSPRYAIRDLRRPQLSTPLLSKWQTLRLKRNKSTFDMWIIETLPKVTQEANRLTRRTAADFITHPDQLLIHNDINWENLIFDSKFNLRAVLDFDNAIVGPRILEVGAAAVVLAGAQRSNVEEFTSAYADVTGVSAGSGDLRVSMSLKCVQSILNSVNAYLSGKTSNTNLLESWSSHLYASLQELTST